MKTKPIQERKPLLSTRVGTQIIELHQGAILIKDDEGVIINTIESVDEHKLYQIYKKLIL